MKLVAFWQWIAGAIWPILSGLLLVGAVRLWAGLAFVFAVPLLFGMHRVQAGGSSRGFWAGIALMCLGVYTCALWWIEASFGYWVWLTSLVCGLYLFLALGLAHLWAKGHMTRWLVGFVLCWLVHEYFHLEAAMGFPWLLLGNILGQQPAWIQWYAYTGVLGGSLWVLLVNVLIFLLLSSRRKVVWGVATAILAWGPWALSWYVWKQPQALSDGDTRFYVVNVNHSAKLGLSSALAADLEAHPEEAFILFPEASIEPLVWHHRPQRHTVLRKMLRHTQQYPAHTIMIGADLAEVQKNPCDECHHDPLLNLSYLKYNVICTLRDSSISYVYKRRFVPFNERVPDGFDFIPYRSLGYATKENTRILPLRHGPLGISICYESFFGEYCRTTPSGESPRVLAFFSSESFMRSDPPKVFYLGISQIRAIEMGCYVVRASDDGYSAVISPKGKLDEAISPESNHPYLVCRVPEVAQTTFFALHGNYIGVFTLWIFILRSLVIMFNFVRKKILLQTLFYFLK